MSIVIWPPGESWGKDPLPAIVPTWIQAVREAARPLEVVTPATEPEALQSAGGAEAWIGNLTPGLLSAAPKLRWLQSPYIGLEEFMFPELIESDVTVTNMRGINSEHIANHALTLFLCLCRDIPRLMRNQIANTWMSKHEAVIRDPRLMTVMVIGLGSIGKEVARRLVALGASIIGVDPQVRGPLPGVTEIVHPDQLKETIARADAVILCAPETPETTGLFDDRMFRRMRRGALLVNVARGRIVELAALERALAGEVIGGAGIDVFETEPLPSDRPLWQMNNVILTPHVAGRGPGTDRHRLDVILENLRRFIDGRPLATVVDKKLFY